MATNASLSVKGVFANTHLVQEHGVGGIFRGLAPTSELGEIATGLGDAIQQSDPSLHRLQTLLATGGTANQIFDAQRSVAAILGKMDPAKESQVLAATGWAASTRRFASDDARISHIGDVIDLADARMGRTLYKLTQVVAIPSLSDSSNPEFRPEGVSRSAEWVAAALSEIRCQNVQILKATGTHPSVYGEIIVDPSKPTVIFYGHHDVQPAGNGWETKPFQAFVRNNRMYARGAADDKGGFMIAWAVVDAYRRSGVRLPVNVIFFIEGEEEIGSPHLGAFMAQVGSSLKADAVILIDTHNIQSGLPTITTSTRGLARILVEVQTLSHQLHSGINGGVTLDANWAMSILLARLRTPDGQLSVPGVTDALPPIPPQVHTALAAIPLDEEEFRRSAGILPGAPVMGDPALTYYERTMRGWSSSVLGWDATQGAKGARGAIADRAAAFLDIRFPPGANGRGAAEKFAAILQKNPPAGAKVTVTIPDPVPAWQTDPTHPVAKLLAEGMRVGFGVQPCFAGCGGGIGFLPDFEKRFPSVPLFPIGVGDPDTRAHGPNESLNIPDFASQVRSLIAFLALMGNREDSIK